MVNWINLAFPFLYLGVLVGALSTFSSLYRKRKLWRAQSLAPWFDSNRPRDVYLSLMHLDDEDSEKPQVPDTVLKAALLRRAQEDVSRVIQMRNSKQALANLLQKGSIGDDLWQRFLRAEQEVEEEIRDVVNEANAFSEGWGSYIFQTAHEMHQNQEIRKIAANGKVEAEQEKDWWTKKNASWANTTDSEPTSPVKAGSKAASDESGVLVEAGGPADVLQQTDNSSSSNLKKKSNKKKGKK